MSKGMNEGRRNMRKEEVTLTVGTYANVLSNDNYGVAFDDLLLITLTLPRCWRYFSPCLVTTSSASLRQDESVLQFRGMAAYYRCLHPTSITFGHFL